MMRRIKYISSFAENLSQEDLDTIVLESMRNNETRGITGALMAAGRMFFQILEGPEEEVEIVYKKILEDPRHRNVMLLRDECGVGSRLFPDWAMKKIDLTPQTNTRLEPLQAILEAIFSQYDSIGRLAHTLETSIWREFATEGPGSR